ncbi:arginase family protein [Mesorhizobium sp.]|uniref:arginase family protein n=1 Tax=Mesorhizobium sp. TaxID=1871066 RepID=UPI0025E1C36B|nr:arginase family protein [Mesorhizobium sp.]
MARHAVLARAREARRLINKHKPDRVAVLGGDCGVDLAPFAYLNKRYDGDLAVLWLDTHSDVWTPNELVYFNSMILGNLMGEGEADFVAEVKRPIKPQNVMFAGRLDTFESLPMLAFENDFFERFKLRSAGPSELAHTSNPVLDWLKSIYAKKTGDSFRSRCSRSDALPLAAVRQSGSVGAEDLLLAFRPDDYRAGRPASFGHSQGC